MEVSLQIAKAPATGNNDTYKPRPVKEEDVYMTCAFTMVSLDPATKKPVNIAPLVLETDAEKAIFRRGEENYKKKKALKSVDIMQKPPDAEESALIHKLWTTSVEYGDKNHPAEQPATTVAMSKTQIHSTQIMQPQYRNRHNFMIFGGFLLKTTFELAFTCVAAFSHERPRFLNLDPSTFEEPVPVGSVLYVGAGISYTEPDPSGGTRVQVMVRTHVRPIEHVERKNTGTFYYTFHVDGDVSVLPQTYSEFMGWVAGRRRAQRMQANFAAESKGQPQFLSPKSDMAME